MATTLADNGRLVIAQGGQLLQRVPMGWVGPPLRRLAGGAPTLPLAIWIAVFIGVPGVFLLLYSFLTYTFFETGRPWTVQNYLDLFSKPAYLKLFTKTLIIGVVITSITLVLASPIAYYLSRVASRRLGVLLLLLAVLPLWMNIVIRNVSWVGLVVNNGILNTGLRAMGLEVLQFHVIFTLNIVIIVGVFLALPFAILVLYATMGGISHEVEEASMDLGNSRFHTFRKVIFPLSASGYQTAGLLIFMPTFALYLTPEMLGGTAGAMFATALMPIVKGVIDFAQGSATVIPVIIFLMVVVYIFRKGINIDNLYSGGVGSSIARHTPRRSPGLLAYTLILLFLTYLPLMSMTLFSFGKNQLAIFPLQGATLNWYADLFNNNTMVNSFKSSIYVALEVALIAVALSAPAAYAVARFRFAGRGLLVFMSLLPMLIPEIVTGMALLILFTTLGLGLSLQSIVVGHVTLALPFVFLTILAQQYGFDRTIEEASKDLGASALAGFAKVTLPLMLPALVAAAFLAITISFNDYIVAFMLVGGGQSTLPLYIFGLQKAGTSPSANALGAILVLAVVLLGVIMFLRPWQVLSKVGRSASLKFARTAA